MDMHAPGLPHDFWQGIHDPGRFDTSPADGFSGFYPANFANGDQILLPIREISAGQNAIASLIINQASFAVLGRFADDLSDLVRATEPEVIVGLPTLGLTLAAEVARKLGHSRYVALSTSRKFWYDDTLSVAMRSITSPTQSKQLYLDPRMLPLLRDKRVLLIDDVLSSGTSIMAGIALLKQCGLQPTAIGAAMLQTDRWAALLKAEGIDPNIVHGVIKTPLLKPNNKGGWVVS